MASQAERFEAVADANVAGPGATDKEVNTGDILAEKQRDGTSSNSSDAVAEQNETEKAQTPAQAPQRSAGKIALIMGSLCIAVFLAALDTTIVTTAIPTITEDFQSSAADYTWIGSAYLLAGAAATPTWGKISDIWGRKPIILLANAIFFVGSLIAALSTNIKMLLAGRVIQGIGGGGLIILANICISDLFSMRERGKYFGMIGGVWGLASAVGPVLGGVFTQKVSWRWCFYINLPFDGLAFAIILFLLDIETPKTPIAAGLKSIDWIGVITVTGGTVMFLLGLEYGGISFPWSSATVICLIVFGIVVLALFFVNEWKFARYPCIPPSLFKRRSSVACFSVCFVHGFVFISGTYFLPLYFQAVLGANPILSGVYLFPFVISLSLMSVFVGIFIKKTGQYLPPIYLGVTLMTLGFGLYIDLPNGREWGRIFPFQIIAGMGVGPLFQAPLIALQTTIPGRDIATATATFGFVRQISTAVSVVIGGVIFNNEITKHKSTLLKALSPAIAQQIGGGGAGAATGIVKSLPEPEKHIATGVYTDSLQTMWIFYCAFSVLGVISALLIGRKVLTKTHEVQKTGLEEEEKHRLERIAERDAKRESKRASRNSLDANKKLSGLKDGGTGRSTPDAATEKVSGDANV
ncbi:hypothetical protein ACLMJK_006778 [Lecanora helva]